MARVSSQHKSGLLVCGVVMLLLSGGIISTGFSNDFEHPYDKVTKVNLYHFLHTQYWVGIPLFFLGIYVILTLYNTDSFLMIIGFFIAALLMTLSMFAVILEGPTWRVALQNAVRVNELKCKTVGGICQCGSAGLLSCNEVRYLALRYSVNVIFSALSIIVCIFCSFIYFRILGWMVHVTPDNSIDDYYAKAFNSRFTNGDHGRGMGRTNDVAMGTYPN